MLGTSSQSCDARLRAHERLEAAATGRPGYRRRRSSAHWPGAVRRSPAARCPGSARPRRGWTGRDRRTPASAASPRRAGAGWRCRGVRRARADATAGARRQHHQAPPSRNRTSVPSAAAQNQSAKRAVGGGGDGERDQAPARPRRWPRAAGATDGRVREQRVAEQRRAGDARGPAERPEREGERGQQAVGCGERERAGIEPEDRRHRQHVLEPGGQRDRRAARRRQGRSRCRRGRAPAPGSGRRRTPGGASAPRQRRVAMVRARASSQARTPLATPMPPTSSEVRPTSVMNRLVCSMKRVTPGAASRGSRMRQPWSGKARRSAASAAERVGQGGADRVLHHGAGGDQAGRRQAHRRRSGRGGRGSAGRRRGRVPRSGRRGR